MNIGLEFHNKFPFEYPKACSINVFSFKQEIKDVSVCCLTILVMLSVRNPHLVSVIKRTANEMTHQATNQYKHHLLYPTHVCYVRRYVNTNCNL